MHENELCSAVIQVLKQWHDRNRVLWHGYCSLLEDVAEIKSNVTLPEIKKALRQLYKQGYVTVEPVYNPSNGMLNGRAYFYNPDFASSEKTQQMQQLPQDKPVTQHTN
jgi:hypothetical protein